MDVNFPENCERFGVELGEVTTLRGATFTPSVSDDGVLSWTNDQGLPNPEPIFLKGENGKTPEVYVDTVEGGHRIMISTEGVQATPTFYVMDGADGKTPVKGEDYWTEADKAEMVEGVLAALPTWTGGSY